MQGTQEKNNLESFIELNNKNMKEKQKCDFVITQFDKSLRDIVTQHTRDTLGHRGNAKYIEMLIKKDLRL